MKVRKGQFLYDRSLKLTGDSKSVNNYCGEKAVRARLWYTVGNGLD